MTSGPPEPHRCAPPFYLGTVITSLEGGRPIIDLIRDAKRAGVSLHVCHPTLPGYKIDASTGLISEVDEGNRASELADLVVLSDKTLTF